MIRLASSNGQHQRITLPVAAADGGHAWPPPRLQVSVIVDASACAERVADRHRPAVRVGLGPQRLLDARPVAVDEAQRAHERSGGKGLVDLEQLDAVNREAARCSSRRMPTAGVDVPEVGPPATWA